MGRVAARALLSGLLLFAGCADEAAVDRVVELDYSQRVLAQHRKRIELLRAGVRPRTESGVQKVWRNAMGYTFVGRGREQEEEGVTGVRVRRNGVPVKEKARGLRRGRLGRFAVQDGFWIVDVFSSVDTYLRSAVAPKGMSERRFLQHLGLARKLSDSADRMLMEPAEQVHWRELLPVVLRNDGYGRLFRRFADPERESEDAGLDTLAVMGKRYQLARLGDYILVGDDRKEQRCWHVFSAGENYLLTVVDHGTPRLAGRAALQAAGLADPDSAERGAATEDTLPRPLPTGSRPAPAAAEME